MIESLFKLFFVVGALVTLAIVAIPVAYCLAIAVTFGAHRGRMIARQHAISRKKHNGF